MTKALHIHRVPVAAVPKAIRVPECAALMRRGLAAAGEDNMMRVVAELLTNHRQLWLVFAPGNPSLLACWMTEVKEDDNGSRWVCISALAGRNAWRWARAMSDRVTAWAAKEGCARVRWAGRAAWGRIEPRARAVGVLNGQTLFERAA